MDLWLCGGPQWASVSASLEAASQCHLFFSSVCNFPSTVSKPVVICKWWCFPWDMIVWGNQITPYKSKHRGLAVTVHFIFVQCLHGPLCKLALWTEVMWLMQCSNKCSCQCCFCNELQGCCKCHYFLNIHLPSAFFRFVMTIHYATFTCQVPLARCFLL